MRIKINIQIFAIVAILILTNQIEIYAWLMLFALIHEVAHMCVGMILNLKPKTLEIQPFGIGVIFESFENSNMKKIIIALAGPIINIIFAIVFSYINVGNKDLIVNANLLLAIFNLMPIYPLDGGRILKVIIKMSKKTSEADEIVNRISNILIIMLTMAASVLILIYKNIGLFIIIMYIWIIVIKENKKYQLRKRIHKLLDEV